MNGIELGKEDLEDGLSSLKRILSLLEETKLFSDASNFELEELKAADFVEQLRERFPKLELKTDDSFKAELQLKLSPNLLNSAIENIFSYFEKTPQSLKVSSLGSVVNLRFSIDGLDCKSLDSQIDKDHSSKVFKLLFAREVFKAQKIICSLSQTLEFEIPSTTA